jgi:cytochrome c
MILMRRCLLSVFLMTFTVTLPVERAAACAVATKAAAKALVLKAVRHLNQRGPHVAFRDFMHPSAGFMAGDLYVWVIDLNGVIVANGRYPQYLGSSMGRGPRSLGMAVLTRARRQGEGWVEYQWYSPCSGRVERKVAYFKRIGGYIVGAGAYPKLGV